MYGRSKKKFVSVSPRETARGRVLRLRPGPGSRPTQRPHTHTQSRPATTAMPPVPRVRLQASAGRFKSTTRPNTLACAELACRGCHLPTLSSTAQGPGLTVAIDQLKKIQRHRRFGKRHFSVRHRLDRAVKPYRHTAPLQRVGGVTSAVQAAEPVTGLVSSGVVNTYKKTGPKARFCDSSGNLNDQKLAVALSV